MNAITETSFRFKNQTAFYRGKVRDVYTIDDRYLVMIVTDRISAFDVVLPRGIPYKGQILNQIATKSMKGTEAILPNWIIGTPDPMVAIGHRCEPIKIEMVVRGYLAGQAWRAYRSGQRELCGVTLPEGMTENDRFPHPIVTPTTKADMGHDEHLSKEAILKHGLASEAEYAQMERYARALFQKGTDDAAAKGLILVDTKYEFGRNNGKIYLIDEIHTPDSSRYFYQEGYWERQQSGAPQKQLSKEFVREWLMANGFQGQAGQSVPEMSDAVVNSISERYIELYEKITGEVFVKQEGSNRIQEMEARIHRFFEKV